MGKKFNTYVAVHKDPAESVWFAPGDDVPDWAVDLVGAHVYEDQGEVEDARLTDPHLEPDTAEVGFTTLTTLPEVVGGVQADEAEADEVDYTRLKKDELIALCEERELDTDGSKAELIERLEADDEEE